MSVRFAITYLLLILSLQTGDNSLLSRFRNPNEFIAADDVLYPEDLDPKTYQDLMEEVPELRSFMKRPQSMNSLQMPYLQKNFEQGDEYNYAVNNAYLDNNFTDVTTSSWEEWNATLDASERSGWDAWNVTPYASMMANANPDYNTSDSQRRWGWNPWRFWWTGKRVATCYRCNVGDRKGIPKNSICHDAFDSQNWRARTLGRYFRARCYRNIYHWGTRIETKKVGTYHHTTDRGLIRGSYGWFIGGCYKKYVDVGKVYTSRGCRSWRPGISSGYAAHRFRKLEWVLRGQKNACVMSPHASLLPFSKAISLYVRFHVCVCEGKYCNSAVGLTAAPFLILFLLYLVL